MITVTPTRPHASAVPLSDSSEAIAPLVVRPARIDDLPAVLGIENSCFPLGVAFTARQVRRLLGNRNAIARVADGAGPRGTNVNIAGWCVGLVRRASEHVTGRIYTLAIDPDCQGRGAGKLLITNMLEALGERGVRRVYLEVRGDNVKAIGLYEKLGFTIVRELRDYYGDGEHGVSMRRTM